MFLSVLLAWACFASIASSAKADSCLHFGGSILAELEVRQNVDGRPGELSQKPKKLKLPIDDSSWCLSTTEARYREEAAGSKPAHEYHYPFDAGFVTNSEVIPATINGRSGKQPLEVAGIARRADGIYTVNWQYTLGGHVTEGRVADPDLSTAELLSSNSLRIELSFEVELTDTLCVVKSYKYSRVYNSGSGKYHGVWVGHFAGTKTISADVNCSAAMR